MEENLTKKKNKTWKLKITKFELVWYIICGVLAVWGIVEIVLGAVALILPKDAPLKLANATYKSIFGLDMLYWGIILLCFGAFFATIVLLIYAKNSDRDFEKAQRRAARLAKENPVKETPEVVDAVVEETK